MSYTFLSTLIYTFFLGFTSKGSAYKCIKEYDYQSVQEKTKFRRRQKLPHINNIA